MTISIPDPNFRLTLLQSLWTAELLPSVEKEDIFKDVLHETYAPEADYNDHVDARIRNYLLSIPLPETALAKLQVLIWDGGDAVHHLIFTNWDGEGEEFNVHDIAGIEACTSLERISFIGGAAFKDCSRLVHLKQLQSVTLHGGWISRLDPVLELANLRAVDVVCVENDENNRVAETLRQRGVSVTLYHA